MSIKRLCYNCMDRGYSEDCLVCNGTGQAYPEFYVKGKLIGVVFDWPTHQVLFVRLSHTSRYALTEQRMELLWSSLGDKGFTETDWSVKEKNRTGMRCPF